MIQMLALGLTTLSVALLAAIFIYIVWCAKDKQDYSVVQATFSRVRGIVFWVAVIVITPILIFTLTMDLPYAAPSSRTVNAQVINITGFQWGWEFSQNTAIVGTPVEFHVTSRDVNHSFAIYDASLKLLAQTQAMPGYVNVLHHTFDRPGTYKILCLEYCGVAHHAMIREFIVNAKN